MQRSPAAAINLAGDRIDGEGLVREADDALFDAMTASTNAVAVAEAVHR